MDSPLLSRPGAVRADPPDGQVAGHYGDPMGEQRRVAEGAAVIDRSNRGVLRICGPDRLSWLHSITTQHLTSMSAGETTEGLVLSPHGHIEHHFVVTDDGTSSWLDVEPGTEAALLAFLESMRFMLRVEPLDVTSSWALLTVVGGSVPEHLVPEAFVRRAPWPLPETVDVLVPRPALVEQVDATGLPLAGLTALEAARVAARRPRLGFETDHRTIPHEVGWLQTAVHLDKGCYRGQETVARVHNLGRPPRRLVFLHLDGTDGRLPSTGAEVTVDDRVVGFVTTAVRHYELGPVALAMVKRNTLDDAALVAGGVPAKVEA